MNGRSTFLIQPDFDRLEDWCRMVYVIFGRPPVLVGSVLEHAAYRDVDVRLVLPNDAFDTLFRQKPEPVRFLNRALSVWGRQETGLPVDFQVQRHSEAAASFEGKPRSPMGVRDWSLIPTSGVPVVSPEAEGRTCPDCHHRHLPMPEPWMASTGLVVPRCDWPEGDGTSCDCQRRA